MSDCALMVGKDCGEKKAVTPGVFLQMTLCFESLVLVIFIFRRPMVSIL